MIFYRNIEKVRAVSFDLDDTLYDNFPIMRRAEKQLLAFMDEHFPQTHDKDMAFWQNIKRKLLKGTPELAFDMGELRRRTLKAGLEQCGYQSKTLDQQVNQCFDYFYYERSNFQVDQSIIALLEELAAKVPLVAITNGNVNLKQIGIEEYFKACFHARLHQPMKPHPKMFELTRDLLNLPAQQILHVGDNFEKDVMGARNVGYATAWFACDREMNLPLEAVTVLPDIQLESLAELNALI